MTQLCEKCGHYYDDEHCWTICPHGPIWAPLNAYCREHDLVNCKLHGEPHEYAQLARSSGAAFVPVNIFTKPKAPITVTFWEGSRRELSGNVWRWLRGWLLYGWRSAGFYNRRARKMVKP